MNIDIKSVALTILVLFLGTFVGRYWGAANMYQGHHMQMVDHMEETDDRESYIATKNHMIGELVSNEEYKCCLEKPCAYCIEKTPNHGEGKNCECLDDVMNSKHPCGECIGEILEGYGNRFLAKYFAAAIAEEVGIKHIDTIKQIIADKYNISIEDQL